jgi:flagellar motility protein MotE (MotC chaperone)
MIRVLQAPYTAMTLGGVVFLTTTLLLLQKPLRTAVTVPEVVEEPVADFWSRHDPEVDQLIAELREEKQDLAKRQAELRELQARLLAERAELNQITQRVAQLQLEFDQNVVRLKEDEAPQMKKLLKMYLSMSPEAVLNIFKEMDDQTVVKLFSLMKETESAPLLEAMAREGEVQARRAATISEALRKIILEKRK